MADISIGDLAIQAPSLASGDLLMAERISDNITVKVPKLAALGGVMTGGGTWVNPGYTFTVPETGTAAIRSGAQSFTGLQTFGSGISFGENTIDNYKLGLWTPVVADAASGGNTGTLTATFASYIRVGDLCLVFGTLTNIGTAGMTGANSLFIRGLPFTSKSTQLAVGYCRVADVTFTNSPCAVIGASVAYVQLAESISGAGFQNITVSDLTSGSADIVFSISYACTD